MLPATSLDDSRLWFNSYKDLKTGELVAYVGKESDIDDQGIYRGNIWDCVKLVGTFFESGIRYPDPETGKFVTMKLKIGQVYWGEAAKAFQYQIEGRPHVKFQVDRATRTDLD